VLALRRATLVALLAIESVLLRLTVRHTFEDRFVLRFELPAIAVFAVALALLVYCDVAGRVGSRLIIGMGTIFQLLALSGPPVDSDDDFRYLWDGKVQAAGIDPYRYAPSSASLLRLHDPFLFPGGTPCRVHAFPGGCTRINLPTAHTIYPPVAEAVFWLLRALSLGGHGRQLPLQAAAALGTLAVSWVLARRALATDLPLWTVALWAWCPVTLIEFSNNAHIDWLGVLLGVLALTASARGRHVWAGVLVGAGIATKLYPGLLGAAMLRRRPLVVVGSAVATVVLAYLPHVVAVGGSVIGYLPSYLSTGGYGSGQQYRLLSPWIPAGVVTPLALTLVVAAISWAVLRADPLHPERAALVVVGAAVLVTTPTLPWYLLLLLALACLNARPEWLGVVVAPTVEYLAVGRGAQLGSATSLAYLAGLVILIIGSCMRWLSRPPPSPSLSPSGDHFRH
jgi:hypothetical protein